MHYNLCMFLVGLGNPGKKYSHNRHNAGMQFVDWLYETCAATRPWLQDTHKQCEYTRIHVQEKNILLFKPLTYMNNSGQAVKSSLRSVAAQYELKHLVIAHDDLDLPLGTWKLDFGKGPKGHNGILSLEEHFGTPLFWRLRVGVDNRKPDIRISGETYVLSDFLPEEKILLDSQYTPMWEAVRKIAFSL